MYEKTIKFKLDKKFFNNSLYLDNKYIYDWLNISRTYFLNSLGIDITTLGEYGFYYADIDTKFSIKKNIKNTNDDIYIKVKLEKHNGIKTVFVYEMYVKQNLIILASSSHNVLKEDEDRPIRMDRYLPKWDQVLKEIIIKDINDKK